MNDDELGKLFLRAKEHREVHKCGGYPYENAEILSLFITSTHAKKILELGTGTGYTAAYMASISHDIHINTIDQDSDHGNLAQKNWQELGVEKQITLHLGKAESILPELKGIYDLIFFDGYSPSMKFLLHFERLLKKNGILMTANMFLKDELGGKYMRALQRTNRYQVGVIEDTTIAVKLFE